MVGHCCSQVNQGSENLIYCVKQLLAQDHVRSERFRYGVLRVMSMSPLRSFLVLEHCLIFLSLLRFNPIQIVLDTDDKH